MANEKKTEESQNPSSPPPPPPASPSHVPNSLKFEHKDSYAHQRWENRISSSPPPPGTPLGREREGKVTLGAAYSETYKPDPLWAKKLSPDTSIGVGNFTGTLEADKLVYDPRKGVVQVIGVYAEAKGSLVHAQTALKVDLGKVVGDSLRNVLFGPTSPVPPGAVAAPMAARIGDLTAHGIPLAPGPGSTNVLIGGLPAWRVGPDLHVCPGHGAGPVAPGAPTVFINGFPAARASDFVVEPMGGPNIIVLGCPTVMIGMVTPPPEGAVGTRKLSETEQLVDWGLDQLSGWVLFETIPQADIGAFKVAGKAYAEADLKKGRVKLEGSAEAFVALLKGDISGKLRVRFPHTDQFVGFGVTAEGSLLSAGAEIGGGAYVNENGKLLDATWGAKAGAGLFGVGLNFGFDIAPAGDSYAHLNKPPVQGKP